MGKNVQRIGKTFVDSPSKMIVLTLQAQIKSFHTVKINISVTKLKTDLFQYYRGAQTNS